MDSHEMDTRAAYQTSVAFVKFSSWPDPQRQDGMAVLQRCSMLLWQAIARDRLFLKIFSFPSTFRFSAQPCRRPSERPWLTAEVFSTSVRRALIPPRM